jgi:hypothetical protein
MPQSPEEAMIEREAARSERRFAELGARLIGYEIALAAIIGALDQSGALPVATARSAIDAAIAGIPATSKNAAEARAVLRQLSGRLGPPAPSEQASSV